MSINTNYDSVITDLNFKYILNSSILKDSVLTTFMSSMSSILSSSEVTTAFKTASFQNDEEKYVESSLNTSLVNYFKSAVTDLTNILKQNILVPLIPESDRTFTIPAVYIDCMRNICVFSYIFISSSIRNTNSSYVSQVKELTSSVVSTNFISIIEKIKLRIQSHSEFQSITNLNAMVASLDSSSVLADVLDEMMTSLLPSTWIITRSERNILECVLKPMTVLLILQTFIPQKTIINSTSSTLATRTFEIRRSYEKMTYQMFMYMFYALYRKSLLLIPNDNVTYMLKDLLNHFINSIFHQSIEYQGGEGYESMVNNLNEMSLIQDASLNLEGQKNKINFLKDQVTNVYINKLELDKKLKNTITRKWLWLSLLCFYIVLFVVCYLLAPLGEWFVYGFGIVSLIIFSSIFILFCYAIVKKYL